MAHDGVNWEKWQEVSHKHFQRVAARYEKGRISDHSRFWTEEIAAQISLEPDDRLLDLGCGTGLFSVPFAEALPSTTVGLDPTPEMLKKAQLHLQATAVRWLCGQGERLPLADNSFRAIFLSQVWHHLADGPRAAAEFHRILKPNGGLFVKTFSHAQIRSRFDLKFVFPELMPFMLDIYPDITNFTKILGQAGFTTITHKTYRKKETLRPSLLLKIAEDRLWSMFAFLSDEGYQAGLAYLQRLIAETKDAPIPNDEMHLLISARK